MKTALSKDPNAGLTQFLRGIKSHWYLFFLSVGIMLTLAYLYTRFATREYQITSTILLQEQQSSRSGSGSNFGNMGSASLLGIKDNIRNEVAIIESRQLAQKVVRSLNLNIKLYANSGFRSYEIYQEAPFDADIAGLKVDSVQARTYVIQLVNAHRFRLINEDDGLDREANFGEPIRLKQYDLILNKKAGNAADRGTYSVAVISEDAAVNQLMSSYTVDFPNDEITAVNMTLYYEHPKKGEVILQKLMDQYLLGNKHERIKTADSTLVFIDERLQIVASELSDVEQEMEKYKSSNSITNISDQSRVLVDNASSYGKMLQEQQTQLSIINQLEGYLEDPDNPRVIPSSLSIQNQTFNSSLSRYNDLLLELESKSLSYTDSNPVIQNLNQQIQTARFNLLENVAAYKKEMQLSSSELLGKTSSLRGQIQGIPEKERIFEDYARQRALKQQLYVYLLQKREEAAIAKNSNLPSARIVDRAKSSRSPVKPRKPIIFFMAFVMGMLVPLTYVNSKDLLHSRIKSELDIEKHSEVAVIGKIGHNATSEQLVIDKTSRTLISESFRSLRTNLQYALDLNKSNVIMATSSMNGEGKTFLVWNLGSALALAGKKVVFIELDLRKPMLANLMGIENDENGFSDFITGDRDIRSVIKPSLFNENCYVITSGTSSSIPSELLLSNKLSYLISELKKSFDFVIIDSPPVGFVSDALVIEKHVDMTIYVCRHNYTNKSQIEIANDLNRNAKIKNLYLVINDVNLSKSSYGYGYGYGIEEPKWKWGKRRY